MSSLYTVENYWLCMNTDGRMLVIVENIILLVETSNLIIYEMWLACAISRVEGKSAFDFRAISTNRI